MSNVIYLSDRTGSGQADVLTHDHTALIGASLRWKRYRSWTASWLPGRCEFCGARFAEGGTPGLNSGYSVIGGGPAGQDDYRWICAVCYETRRDYFCWTVLDTRGHASEPPGLLEVALELMAWPDDVMAEEADGGI